MAPHDHMDHAALVEVDDLASIARGERPSRVFIRFIRSRGTDPPPADLAAQVALWRDCLPRSARFPDVSAFAVTLDDMTATDYVESDRLDLDHLSLAA